jgi:Leucine-rich repeat (LRR) protein
MKNELKLLNFNETHYISESANFNLNEIINLKKIILTNNQIIQKSNNISIILDNLTNLHTLYLDYNNISIIPDNINKLINLRILFLCKNNISNIPNSIGSLINLTILSLSYNKISIIPKCIGNLINFKFKL